MPNKVEITRVESVAYKIDDEFTSGFISFSYPGKFIGYGENMEEALQMAKMRYRTAKKKYIESGHSEADWLTYAVQRSQKMELILSKSGIKEASTWSEDKLDKTS